jgi:crossover junction endodeoxyribonuclease RusA
MSTLTIDVAHPRRLVSGNRRIHHMVRAEVCAYWRKLAHDVAVDAYGYADVGQAWHQKARIVVWVRFPDKRRRDVSNLYPYVAKPLVDGLVDARVLPDDDDHHLIGPDLRRDLTRGPHQVRIDIEDIP